MSHASTPDLLTLHAIRLLGSARIEAIAERFRLDPDEVTRLVGQFAERGWITAQTSDGVTQWSLTDAGRAANEAQLTDELDAVGARADVQRLLGRFDLHRTSVEELCSAAEADPSPYAQDAARIQLSGFTCYVQETEKAITPHLPRFDGYYRRFSGALFRAEDDPVWLAGDDVDSCRRIWRELNEDLLATLNERE